MNGAPTRTLRASIAPPGSRPARWGNCAPARRSRSCCPPRSAASSSATTMAPSGTIATTLRRGTAPRRWPSPSALLCAMREGRNVPFRRSCQSLSAGGLGRRQRGVVLILAIFAVVLLSVLAVGISAAVRSELRASHLSLERMQGLFLAEAAIRQARAVLLYDDQKLDALSDPWGPDCLRPLDVPRAYGEGFWFASIEDACGRININEADPETLFRLTRA